MVDRHLLLLLSESVLGISHSELPPKQAIDVCLCLYVCVCVCVSACECMCVHVHTVSLMLRTIS